MTKLREKWFMRWVWIPVHWKGFAFFAVALPLMAALLFLVLPRIDHDMAVVVVVVTALVLNVFMFSKS